MLLLSRSRDHAVPADRQARFPCAFEGGGGPLGGFSGQVFSLANTCAMGLRSALYGGRKRSFAWPAQMAARTALPLWPPTLSMTTMSSGVYAASFGMALSTNRKNRVLRARDLNLRRACE